MEKEIRFYYRDGCHLCEEMAAVLHQNWPEHFARTEWIPVDSRPELEQQYGPLVPVLAVDGETICHYVADMDQITACFGPPVNPV